MRNARHRMAAMAKAKRHARHHNACGISSLSIMAMKQTQWQARINQQQRGASSWRKSSKQWRLISHRHG